MYKVCMHACIHAGKILKQINIATLICTDISICYHEHLYHYDTVGWVGSPSYIVYLILFLSPSHDSLVILSCSMKAALGSFKSPGLTYNPNNLFSKLKQGKSLKHPNLGTLKMKTFINSQSSYDQSLNT